jgi:hypothetical protein
LGYSLALFWDRWQMVEISGEKGPVPTHPPVKSRFSTI